VSNYGSIVRTRGEDADPLDVLIYTRSPVPLGVLIKVRPIGVMRMVDGGEVDDKIIAVPTSKVDPTYDNIKDAADQSPSTCYSGEMP
jgi:inorganic pyrophosphatase